MYVWKRFHPRRNNDMLSPSVTQLKDLPAPLLLRDYKCFVGISCNKIFFLRAKSIDITIACLKIPFFKNLFCRNQSNLFDCFPHEISLMLVKGVSARVIKYISLINVGTKSCH